MSIEEEIRKRAEEYATEYGASVGKHVQDDLIKIATEFYEKGRYELLKQLVEICDEKRIQRHLLAFSLYEIEALIKSPQTKQKDGE